MAEKVVCWARSHFDTTSKCEHDNFPGSLNKMILSLRDMPLIKLVEQFQILVMSLLYKKNNSLVGVDPDALEPRVALTLEKLKKHYNKVSTQGRTYHLHVAINKYVGQ